MAGRTQQRFLSDEAGSSAVGYFTLLLTIAVISSIAFAGLGEGFDDSLVGLNRTGATRSVVGAATWAGSDDPAPQELEEPEVHVEVQPGTPEPQAPSKPADQPLADESDFTPTGPNGGSPERSWLDGERKVVDLLLTAIEEVGGEQPATLADGRQVTSRAAPAVSGRSESVESPWKIDDRGIRSLSDIEDILAKHYDEVVTRLWGNRYSTWNDPEILRGLVRHGSPQVASNEQDALRLAALLELTKEHACNGFWCKQTGSRDPLRPIDSQSCSLAGLGDACEKLVTDLARVPALAVQGENDNVAMSPRDIKQGEAQNCYLLASLGALTLADQQRLKQLIKDNGDGTFTVTFHDFDPETRSVDGTTPITVRPDGGRADVGDTLGAYRGSLPVWLAEELRPQVAEVWVQVLEQAYAEWRGGYYRIENRGYVQDAFLALTGSAETVGFAGCDDRACYHSNLDVSRVIDAYSAMEINDREQGYSRLRQWKNEGRPIAVTSINNANEHQARIVDRNSIITGHAYYVETIDDDSVVLRNPYGWDPSPYNSRQGRIELSREDFLAVFSDASAGPIPLSHGTSGGGSGGGRITYR